MWRWLAAIGVTCILVACSATGGPDLLETPSGHYTGGIFLLRDRVGDVQRYLEAIPQQYVRGALKYLATRDVDQIPNTEAVHTVVFFLDQDLPTGTYLRITHQFQRYRGGKLVSLQPFEFSYRTKPDSNPVVVLNESYAGGANGYLIYRLYVENELAAIKRVEIVMR